MNELDCFQFLMEHIPDAIYFKDCDSRFIIVSRAQVLRFGANSPEELIGKTDSDFFSSEHAEEARRDEQRIIETGEPVVAKIEKETWPNGKQTWVSTSKLPLRDSKGQIIGTFGISRDVTDLILARQALHQSEEQLRAKNEQLLQELERARQILRALLPRTTKIDPRLSLECRHRPLEAIGGDFYSLERWSDDACSIFVADVVGHGVSAALYITLLRYLYERHHVSDGFWPAQLLEKLNAELLCHIEVGFVAALYCLLKIDEPSRRATLRFVNAGQPELLIQRRGSERVEVIEERSNAALGIIPNFEPMETTLTIEPGDRFFLLTDGVLEQCNDEKEDFGMSRLIRLLANNRHLNLPECLDTIMAELTQFGNDHQTDDILIVGVELLEEDKG